jgi:hypothetical protein
MRSGRAVPANVPAKAASANRSAVRAGGGGEVGGRSERADNERAFENIVMARNRVGNLGSLAAWGAPTDRRAWRG